ncbi:unnamed protein product, partial [Polarella glacialis]
MTARSDELGEIDEKRSGSWASATGSSFPAVGEGWSENWRWGLWSPSDKAWHNFLKNLWCEAATSEGRPVIPLRLHQIWLGPRQLPAECQQFAQGWRGRHPAWEYRLWTDADAEAELQDLPRMAEAFRAAKNPAEKSDLLRLAIVLHHGGLYVDVDFECLRPFDELHDRVSFYTGISNVAAFELNNGLFAAAPGHPLLRYLCERVGRRWAEWGEEDVDTREAVAYQLEKSGMMGSMSELTSVGKAAFLATTGPGFFTRGVLRGLQHV